MSLFEIFAIAVALFLLIFYRVHLYRPRRPDRPFRESPEPVLAAA